MAPTKFVGLVSLTAVLGLFFFAFHNGSLHTAYEKLMPLTQKSSGAMTITTTRDIPLDTAVFVTAADKSHFQESKDSIASIQTNLPTHRIIYYDLGLTKKQIEEIKSWCRVSYIMFEMSKYPPHVRNLHSYAWKPLIVQEILQKHPAVIWFDSSARFKCPQFISQITPTLRKSGVAMIDRTGHSTFAVTHPGMYKYLPKNLTSLQKVQQLGASLYGILNTTRIFDNVLKPLVKCSLIKECIFPAGSTIYCNFHKNGYTRYANCHRYDQSALNILLLELFKGDINAYFANNTCATVERQSTSYFKLQLCK